MGLFERSILNTRWAARSSGPTSRRLVRPLLAARSLGAMGVWFLIDSKDQRVDYMTKRLVRDLFENNRRGVQGW